MRRGTIGCLLAVSMAGCSSHTDTKAEIATHTELVAALDDGTRAQVPALYVDAIQGQGGGQQGYVVGETVGERIGNYSENFPFSPAYGQGAWVVLGVQGAIYLLGLPIAAATTGPSPERVAEAQAALKPILADEAWGEKVRDAFVTVMQSSQTAAMIADEESSAPVKLTLSVDGPALKIVEESGQPMLMVRGMLEKDGACLADRRWQWNGGPSDYFDLAEDEAEELRLQLEGGVKQIGLAIAEDLFLSDAPRKVAFADGAVMHKTTPIMTARSDEYSNLVASWDETLGADAAAPCGKSALPAVPPPTLIVAQPTKAAQSSPSPTSEAAPEVAGLSKRRSSGVHCLNPRTHEVYRSVPYGCDAADHQMTSAEYEAWKTKQAAN